MTVIYFMYYNSFGNLQECSYGGPSLESGLDMLTDLVNHGWKLTNIRLIDSGGTLIPLPVDAFDGNYFNEPLRELRKEWEELLFMAS